MNSQGIAPDEDRMGAAVVELQGLIQHNYPDACFEVRRGEDPEGTYVLVTVDIEDPDEVVDVYVERLLELQVDEGLPLYVIPIRPLSRVTIS